MNHIPIALWAVLALSWGVVCDASDDEKGGESTMVLPASKHSRELPKDAVYVTIRVHRDGRIDLDRSNLDAFLKGSGYREKANSRRESLSLEALRRELGEMRILFGTVAQRAGKKPWLKDELGGSTSTMEIRYEFDHRVEVGRAGWVLTTAVQSGFAIGRLVVRGQEGEALRGLNADAWHWIHQWNPARPASGPVLATVVMQKTSEANKKRWCYRFAGREYPSESSLRRAVEDAGKYLEQHVKRKLAIALVTGSATPLQRYVDLADEVNASGVAELAFTGTRIPPRSVARAKALPVPKPAVFILDAMLAMEQEVESPAETGDGAEAAAMSKVAVAKALAEFPAGAPEELSEWMRSKSPPKSD